MTAATPPETSADVVVIGIRSSFTHRVNVELGLRGLAEYSSFWIEIDFRRDGYLGELIRDLYLGHEPTIDIAELDVRRFAEAGAAREHNIV